jgi:hypothetical protein
MDYRDERGFSFYGIIWALIIVGVIGTLAMRLVNPILQYQTIDSVVADLLTKPDDYSRSNDEIMTLIKRRLKINSTELPSDDAIKILKKEDRTQIIINYRTEVPLYANAKIALYFSNAHQSSNNDSEMN